MSDKEDSNLIEDAIRKAIPVNEDFDPGDILTDWVVVGYCANPEREKGGRYLAFVPDGRCPTYRINGLLQYAIDMNLAYEASNDGDD